MQALPFRFPAKRKNALKSCGLNEGQTSCRRISIRIDLEDELRATLRTMWPGNEPEIWRDANSEAHNRRWITFPSLPHLKQYWQATYFVQIQAEIPRDVRFKVVMSADEFRGPVIETESTHLID